MCFTRNKSVLFAIVLAIVTVSTVFIIMTDNEDSKAADPYDSSIHVAKIGDNGYATLQEACDDAADGAVIEITDNIELSTTLRIVKPLYLTTNCGAIIKPSSTFVPGNYLGENWPVLIHVDGNYTDHSTKGKLIIGTSTTSNPEEMLTLDGDNRYMVIYCEKRGSELLPGKCTLTLNAGTITGGYTSSSGAGIHVTRAATFEMNGGTITGNHLDPTKPSYHVYQYSEDVWIGSGAQATINNGTIGKLLVRAWYDGGALGGSITLKGGSVDTIYLDHCYYAQNNPILTNGASLIYPNDSTATLDHLLISTSKNVYNNPVTFRYAEEPNPVKGDTYRGGSHVAMVNGYGYKTMEEAIAAAGDGDTVTIIGDVNLSNLINVTKNITLEIGEYYTGGSTSKPYILLDNNNLKFEVSINMNGGTMNTTGWTNDNGIYTAYHEYGTQISDIVNSLEAPVRTGYTFTGWSYTDGTLGSVSSSITANYTANEYDIHLHQGDEGDSHGVAKVSFDGTVVNIINHAIKDGYKLIGYFTHESGGTKVLNPDGSFASHNVDEHITDGKWSKDAHHTLYAQWEIDISNTITNDVDYLKDHKYLLYAVVITTTEALLVIGVAMLFRRR